MESSPKRFLCIAFLTISLASVSLCSSAFADDKKCTDDTSCTKFGLSHCDATTKQCVCDPGCVEDSKTKKCVHATLGATCTADPDCKFITNGVCKAKVCACEEGYIGNKAGDACTLAKIDDECTSDVDCKLIGNATCAPCASRSSVAVCKACTCNDGFGGSENREACLPLIEIGKQCELHDDTGVCGKYAECVNSTCTCTVGYMKKDKFPFDCKGGIHEYCQNAKDCYDKYAVCRAVNATILLASCECPKEHPFVKDHCSSAGTTAFSAFSIFGTLLALATKLVIS